MGLQGGDAQKGLGSNVWNSQVTQLQRLWPNDFLLRIELIQSIQRPGPCRWLSSLLWRSTQSSPQTSTTKMAESPLRDISLKTHTPQIQMFVVPMFCVRCSQQFEMLIQYKSVSSKPEFQSSYRQCKLFVFVSLIYVCISPIFFGMECHCHDSN